MSTATVDSFATALAAHLTKSGPHAWDVVQPEHRNGVILQCAGPEELDTHTQIHVVRQSETGRVRLRPQRLVVGHRPMLLEDAVEGDVLDGMTSVLANDTVTIRRVATRLAAQLPAYRDVLALMIHERDKATREQCEAKELADAIVARHGGEVRSENGSRLVAYTNLPDARRIEVGRTSALNLYNLTPAKLLRVLDALAEPDPQASPT